MTIRKSGVGGGGASGETVEKVSVPISGDFYPARACASKGLCDRSWCLYIYCCIL